MLIIGHCPSRLEEIPTDTTQSSYRGDLAAADPFETPATDRAGWIRDDPVTRGNSQNPPSHATLKGSPWPSQAAPSESSPTASSFASHPATHVFEIWRQLPQEVGHLLSARLLLMARRVQENRRSVSLHNGGSQ
jgi:hypothetical protein